MVLPSLPENNCTALCTALCPLTISLLPGAFLNSWNAAEQLLYANGARCRMDRPLVCPMLCRRPAACYPTPWLHGDALLFPTAIYILSSSDSVTPMCAAA